MSRCKKLDWNTFAAEITAAIRQVDPDMPILDNPLLDVLRNRWAQNVTFLGPSTAPAPTPTSGDW